MVLLMVIAMAFMLGLGGGHMHTMGHESHSPDTEATKPQALQQGTSFNRLMMRIVLQHVAVKRATTRRPTVTTVFSLWPRDTLVNSHLVARYLTHTLQPLLPSPQTLGNQTASIALLTKMGMTLVFRYPFNTSWSFE